MNANEGNGERTVLFHFKRVAGIALSVTICACLGILAALLLVTEDPGLGYAQTIVSYSFTSRNLGWCLLVFGLAIIAVSGFTTWLVALYSSFRIAGPLYRFARNLEICIAQRAAELLHIRSTDQLRRESRALQGSVTKLRVHDDELRKALRGVRMSLQFESPNGELTKLHAARFRSTERRVRL